jgi:predicted dehydrogenase
MTWNIAFYGAGDRATPYLKALGRRTDVQITAVCDLDHRAAEQVAAGWGATAYLSYEAMLQESRPDALWICVEPHLQGDILLKAAEQGIPFFVEPPGALDFDRARLYARAVADRNLVTAVGYRTRHTDVLQEAREYLGANPVPLALGWSPRPPETADGTAGPASATAPL